MADISSSSLVATLDELSYADRSSISSSSSSSTTSTASSDLGKEEFLQLLVCQLQNQDPLNPEEDTEFISQLAQFSSLEQMTNMNTTLTNTSAYGIVGKEVIIEHSDDLGNVSEISGVVDYVQIKNGDAYLSVNGNTYSMDELVQVMDTSYAVQSHLPSVSQQTLTYDSDNPKDVTVTLNLGDEGYEASSVAVAVNGDYIDSGLMKYEDGELTISSDAFKDLQSGSYYLGFFFDDTYSTSVTDKVVVKVVNSGVVQNETETTQEA